MKRINAKGFGSIETLLIVVIAGIIGATGYYVYNSQRKTNATLDNAAKSQGELQKTSKKADTKPRYTLPTGWSEINCDVGPQKISLAYPVGDKAQDCNDRTNVILIAYHEGQARCMTEAELSESTKPHYDYTCEEMTIGTAKVIKTQEDAGGGPSITYAFANDEPINITYYSTEDGKLPNSSSVEELAQSVKF